MGEPDRRVGLVDVLAAGALRPERVDADVVPVEFDLDVVTDLRQDLDEGERRLPPLLGIERADSDQPVDATLGTQPAVRRPPVDLDGGALEPGLLAFLLVDDLGLEPMALRPAQVHPNEHFGPVRRLGAPGAGADRQDRAALVVLAREEERGPLALEIPVELGGAAVELRGQLFVTGFLDELERREQIVDAGLEAAPELDLGTEAVGLTEHLLGGSLVVPEAGLERQRLELADAAFLRPEVKDAPRSTGSDPPGRERWRRPLSSGPGGPGGGSDGARSAAAPTCSGRRRGSRRDSRSCEGRRRSCRRSRGPLRSCTTGSHVRRR